MKEMIEKAVRSYYGYDIEAYQHWVSEIEDHIKKEPNENKRAELIGEYKLVCSLVYLNMPEKLCEFYSEAVKCRVKSDIFEINETFLLAWAYDDLIEYFGMPLEKADTVAEALDKAVALHAELSNAANGTDMLYRAEVAMRRNEFEKALYYAREAKKLLPMKNLAAHACSDRISECAYRAIRFE